MSNIGGALARRTTRAGMSVLAASVAVALAWVGALTVAPSTAEAAYANDTWSGYNEFGYAAAPRKARQSSAFSRGIRKHVERSERRARKSASRRSAKRERHAALHRSATDASPAPTAKPSLGSGGGIRWAASSGCLNGRLRAVVAQVAANYGPVTVNSTCRNKRHNARVGGARHSHHLTGDAVDFRLRGNVRGAIAYLSSGSGRVGGFKHYGGGLFHVDTGPRRTW